LAGNLSPGVISYNQIEVKVNFMMLGNTPGGIPRDYPYSDRGSGQEYGLVP